MSWFPASRAITTAAAVRDLAGAPPRARVVAAHALGDVAPDERDRARAALIAALTDDRGEVRASVVAGERVDLVDHDRRQVLEQRPRVGLLADEHDLEGLGGRHQHVGRGAAEARLLRVANVTVPFEDVQAHHPAIATSTTTPTTPSWMLF